MTTLPTIVGSIPTVFAGRPDDSGDLGAGITASFGILSFRGKIWRTKYKGEERAIMRPDEPGSPVSFLDLVIVKASPVISKIFYLQGYQEGDTQAPDCFSVNGVTPDPASPAKQAPHCATCPHNVWGSRVTEAGKKGKACSDSKRMAVVPEADLRNEAFGGPMMLRCPPASLQGLSTYSADLQRAGGRYYGAVTRVHFDLQVAYPHLVFMPKRWLTNEEASVIIELQDGPVVQRILTEAVEAVRAEGDAPPNVPPATAHMAGAPPTVASTVAASVNPTPAQPETIEQMRERIRAEVLADMEAKARAAAPPVIHAPDQSGVIVTPPPSPTAAAAIIAAAPAADPLAIPAFLKGAGPQTSAFAPPPPPAAVVAPPLVVQPTAPTTFAPPAGVLPNPAQPAAGRPETQEEMRARIEAEVRARIAAETPARGRGAPRGPRTKPPSPTNGGSAPAGAPSAFGQPAPVAAPAGVHPDPAFATAIAQPAQVTQPVQTGFGFGQPAATPPAATQPAATQPAEPGMAPQPGPGSSALADLNAKLDTLLPNT